MKKIGFINRGMANVVSKQGHQDLLMVVDAGFAIPENVDIVDISLCENHPMVLDVLAELKKYHSVEKMIIANKTQEISPTLFASIIKVWGENMDVEVVDHMKLKQMSKDVKAIIRTGDFTAYGNVILVSGAGDRWFCEKS